MQGKPPLILPLALLYNRPIASFFVFSCADLCIAYLIGKITDWIVKMNLEDDKQYNVDTSYSSKLYNYQVASELMFCFILIC